MKILEHINQEGDVIKSLLSKDYNYSFNKTNGEFARWGSTIEEDPNVSPYGPEILDIEISTVCNNGCKFCYKSNTGVGENMSYEDFIRIIDSMPPTLTQVALGIGDIDANKDLWRIMAYCRYKGIIPNITINGKGMTPEKYDQLVKLCGAVAVSVYNKDDCYNAIQELSNRGLQQVNIHCLLSENTYNKCFEVMDDSKTDTRLAKLNAIVFLWIKPKGDRNTLKPITSLEKLKKLFDYAYNKDISIGFDSCSANNVLKIINSNNEYKDMAESIEPCESSLFSYYINVKGEGYPCSFSEGIISGIDLLTEKFDAWNHAHTCKFRKDLLQNQRNCSVYNLKVKEK